MNAEAPNIAARGRYTASNAAKVLGIHRNTLLGYNKAGLIEKRESPMGRAYYLGRDLQKLWKML